MCSVTTRDECRAWSIDTMTDYLKHKKSLATKSKKKPLTFASTSASPIPPAVASSPLVGSPPRLPSGSDDAKIRDTVFSVLDALSQSGSVGNNPFSFSAPSSVPNSVTQERGTTGGEGGRQPHHMGGPTRSSGVGACKYSSPPATSLFVHSDLSVPMSFSDKSAYLSDSARESRDSASLGFPLSQLASSGLDQLRVGGDSSIVYSAPSGILSPYSLLFPPDSGFSSLPTSSSGFPASAFSAPPSPLFSSSSLPLPYFSSYVSSASFLLLFLLPFFLLLFLFFLLLPYLPLLLLRFPFPLLPLCLRSLFLLLRIPLLLCLLPGFLLLLVFFLLLLLLLPLLLLPTLSFPSFLLLLPAPGLFRFPLRLPLLPLLLFTLHLLPLLRIILLGLRTIMLGLWVCLQNIRFLLTGF